MYVFFFKQKTAYEMRISDWSSDVCSSDLVGSNYEAGIKAEFFDKRFYVSLAGFHMKQDNIAVLDPSVPPNSLPGGGSAYMALSGAKTWDGEFEVAGEPLPGWSLSGGYHYARTAETGGERGHRKGVGSGKRG